MEIGSIEWQNFIRDGAKELGLEINAGLTAQFSIHALELVKWNRKINLTSITQPRDIAVKHFLDSLAPARFIPENARLLDIGSGGGFPGIPLKILKPSLSVLLVDGVRKKANFLKHLLRTLRLENIEALQTRAEGLPEDPQYANSFDVIISRALSSLAAFAKMAMPLLSAHGVIIAMKGKADQKELDTVRPEAPGDQYALEVESYRLPSIDVLRSIVILRKS